MIESLFYVFYYLLLSMREVGVMAVVYTTEAMGVTVMVEVTMVATVITAGQSE